MKSLGGHKILKYEVSMKQSGNPVVASSCEYPFCDLSIIVALSHNKLWQPVVVPVSFMKSE